MALPLPVGLTQLLYLSPLSNSSANRMQAPSTAHCVRQALAFPSRHQLGARVEHLVAAQDSPSLMQLIMTEFSLPKDLVEGLFHFGAVHWCPVPPAIPGEAAAKMPAERVAAAAARRQGLLASLPKQANLDRTRRSTTDTAVNKGAYVRVHLYPKRFPLAHEWDWKAAIAYECLAFVVVHKPGGVPVAPVVCNLLECTVECTAQALARRPLFITHRLDTCTEGLHLLACSSAAAGRINSLIRSGGIRKFYRALTEHPPPLGKLVHHLLIKQREKGESQHTRVVDQPVPGSLESSLEVLSVEHVQLKPQLTSLATGWPAGAYECLLELHTGRTHQIRAQLAAVGCPVLWDSLYGSPQLLHPEAGRRLQVAPQGAIALQACQLVISDPELTLLEVPELTVKAVIAPLWRR